MSQYTVTVKLERAYEITSDSAVVAIARAKQLVRMVDPKVKLVGVKVERTKPKRT